MAESGQHRSRGDPGSIAGAGAQLRFTQSDLEAFSAASHDANPIHLDAGYARKTAYGQPVVFGALAVSRCLEHLAQVCGRHAFRLEVAFSHPLFVDVDYELRVRDLQQDAAVLELREGSLVLVEVRAGLRAPAPTGSARHGDPAPPRPPPVAPQLRHTARDYDEQELLAAPAISGVYATGRLGARGTQGTAGSLAPLQSDVLMLCSYLVGMELPGRRSLLFKLRLEFAGTMVDSSALPHLYYAAQARHYEPAYGLLEMDLRVDGAAGSVVQGTIGALVRKRIDPPDASRIRACLTAPRGSLSGKVALVTGGSRGLGAAIVHALALQGCDVILNFLRSSDAAEALRARLRDAPGTVTLRQGDCGSPAWCDRTRDWLRETHGGLDFLVLNACAPPFALGESASGLARRQRYFDDNLALATAPVEALVGLLEARHGVLAAVSSSIVAGEARHWPHYQSLKRAVESTVHAAVERHPLIRGLIVRPPALLTDMSNTASRSVGALAPEVVAGRLVDEVAAQAQAGRVEVLSDFAAEPQPSTATEEVRVPQPRASIRLAATFTAKPLLPLLDFWCKELGWSAAAELAPYNQIYQELLDPHSALSSNRSGLNVILLRFGDWLRERPPGGLDAAEAFLGKVLTDCIDALRAYCRRPHCQTLLLICPESPGPGDDPAGRQLLRGLAETLVRSVEELSGLDALWAEDWHAKYQLGGGIHDALSNEIGHIPFTPAYHAFLATLIARRFHALETRPCKVIAVDCDNTLWRGVCGEVGASGITIDAAAHALQQFLLAQKRQGMLLCLCSKNNAEDVEQVFETRSDMPLARGDFVDGRVNWQPKSENLRSLAAALNLGLDSFVFLDDSMIECAEVAAGCPQVLALPVPAGAAELEQLLDHTWVFDHFGATEEDGKRTAFYQADRQRRQLQEARGDFRAFLDGLALEVEIERPASGDLARIVQLGQRTNQFNFTTIRRSEREVEALIESPRSSQLPGERAAADASAPECRVVRVRDRFGEYGLVGLITFAQDGGALAVDSFMLSCRVLGRGVEHCMMAYLGELAQARALAQVKVLFRDTSRNRPARLFLEELVGLAAGAAGADGEWWFGAEALGRVRYEPGNVEVDDSHTASTESAIVTTEAGSAALAAGPSWQRIAELSDPQALASRVRRSVPPRTAVPAGGSTRGGGSGAAAVEARRALRYAPLLEKLRALFAQTLGLDPADVDADRELERYVTDSLDNVTLTVELKKRFPDIPITILFEHRSLGSIARYLADEHGGVPREPVDPVAADLPPPRASGSVSRDETAPPAPQLMRTAADGAVAIIGMNGRYPQAPTLQAFWENLLAGRSCLSEIPAERWQVDAFFAAERNAGKSYCKRGGFLDGVDRFDAALFHISPREAELMDPQQRLFLEVVWGLLEDAGYTRATIARDTGVFVGCNASDYALYANTLALQGTSAYRNADSFQIPNRVSYFFDLRGPSLCIDTACSASGTAVYLACQSLRTGQCRVAIAGGINLFLHPSRFIQYSQMQMLSPTGQCSPFGAEANGTVFGEGVGALLLKPLAAAERDGDHIYAVIKGCAINSGGKTNGFTVPNPQAHAVLVSQALREAQVDPATITYVEAHGTGTPLGDPIEIRGLSMAFEQNYGAVEQNPPRAHPATQFCAIGSVKANIGHLEAGAAIAGITKTVMQMNRGILVPSLNARNPNPGIPFGTSPFFIPQELRAWERPVLSSDGHATTYPRRAGISSFGAGGSNAHIVLEEYCPPPAPESDRPEPELVLLSARNRDALRACATRLVASLRRVSGRAGGTQPRLTDVAFTLQVGREEMDERLALVVSSLDELAERLSSWVALSDERLADSGFNLDNVYWGRAKSGQLRSTSAAHSPPPAAKGELDPSEAMLPDQCSLADLARLWVGGTGISWPLLPEDRRAGAGAASAPQRVSLPGHVFAGERFWLPGEPNLKLAQAHRGEARGLHPLLDSVEAARSLGPGIVFRKNLAACEPIARDHVVRNQNLLPGVACLEMVCAALGRIGVDQPVRIGEVVWSRPIVIGEAAEDILVSIVETEAGDLRYSVQARGEAQGAPGASGTVRRRERGGDAAREQVQIDAIRARCPQTLDRDAIYRRFHSIGIDYGPYFQSLESVHRNAEEALGTIRLPDPFRGELEHYTLHPSVVDAALQTALLVDAGAATALPFSVAEVEILRSPGASAYAYARRIAPRRFDVSVLDETGSVCVRFRDLCLRALKDPVERFLFTPRWKPAPLRKRTDEGVEPDAQHVLIMYSRQSEALADALAAHHVSASVQRILLADEAGQPQAHGDDEPGEDHDPVGSAASLERVKRIYFLGGVRTEPEDIGDLDALERSQETGTLALFRTLKRLNERGLTSRPLELFIVTNDVFAVPQQARTRPHSAGLLGLGQVMAKELPWLRVRCVDVSLAGLPPMPSQAQWQAVLRPILLEPAQSGGAVVIRDGLRYVRVLEPTRVSAASKLPYRQGGVYLILGGAGGLGYELSLHLADAVRARLVWLGRSALDPDKRKRIAQIEAHGGEVLYLQADATDLASMRTAVRQAKQKFGAIHGAVHSAIVLSDRTLANMTESEFRAAYAPKVRGSAVLYKVLEHEALDFLLFFSSANSFMASMGQANYVAGCCFKDALGRHLDAVAGFPCRVINWGYWGTTGIVSGQDYQRRMAAQGHRSIHPQQGMDAIDRVLSGRAAQTVAVNADDKPLAAMGVDLSAEVEMYPEEIPALMHEMLAQEHPPVLERRYVDRFPQGFERLEALGRAWLVAALRRMGMRLEPQARHDRAKLRAGLGVTEGYSRLLDSVLDLLAEGGLLTRADAELVGTGKLRDPVFSSEPADFERMKDDLAREFPEVADRVPLLAACLPSLPEILTGRTGHMEVMFPGGSLALVEGIYAGNAITACFNERLARLVASYVRLRLAADPQASIRILELGAGTGGSSVPVLEALQAFAPRVRYFYTDISKRFLQHGEAAFAGRYAFAEFQRLDMEEDPELQGFERGSMDLVFGTNCVHATRNITATVHRIQRLLKTRGVLILNEFTERLDYNTLTFGLTSGWWLFDDDAFRIEGAPLLDRDGWRHVLTGNGIEGVRFLDLAEGADMSVGQCLIIGESDGRAILHKPVAPEEASEAEATPPQENGTAAAAPLPENEQAVAALAPDQHRARQLRAPTLAYIKKVFADVLRMRDSDLDSDATFEKYGVDSLMALSVTQRFEQDFGARLPATLLFEYPTAAALADYALEQHREILEQRFGTGEQLRQQPSPGSAPQAPATTQRVAEPAGGPVSSVGNVETRASSAPRLAAQHDARAAQRSSAAAVEDEDIAIIGIAGRYPLADSVDALWENLKAGRNCVTEIPRARWEAQAHYAADADGSERSRSKWGGFIDDVDKFDALFFNVSPKEARSMDPQERLLLETVWHTVEAAGYTRRSLAALQKREGRGIGVFVGCMYQQYPFVAADHAAGALLSTSSYWAIANRISYFLNLTGPSFAVDSACSSSLTAIHLACESLRRGESSMAIAGGVNLNLHPSKYLRLQQLGMLASTPESRSLGDGDGLVPGEGVGAVLLKPLSSALRDGDIVHAVIKRTVINHGGKTGGFTVPSPNAQADLIADLLQKAQVDPRTINYVEVAANGSALGDAIEIAGLTKAFQRFTSERQFCAIGTVKSNLGHLEAASGIAQLTKVVLQLKHGMLVPSLNAEPCNPNLHLEASPFYVQQRLSEWERSRPSEARRAAISSFGAGGSNAHILIEEYPLAESEPAVRTDEAPQLIVLSARTKDSLREYCLRLIGFLRGGIAPAAGHGVEHAWLPALREDLLTFTAEILRVSRNDIDLDRDLSEYGFDAGHYTALVQRLRERYGIELSATALVRAGSLEGAAGCLASEHRQALEALHGESRAMQPSFREPTLADIAHTLQIGREAMRERLATVVSSKDELADRLERYCRGDTDIDNLQQARASLTAAALIGDDVEDSAYLDSLARNRKLGKIAQLWVNGFDIDWERLHPADGEAGRPRRVTLPTYSFAKQRCWVDDSPAVATTQLREVLPSSAPAAGRDAVPAPEASSPVPTPASSRGRPTRRDADAEAPDALMRDIARLVSDLLEVEQDEIDFEEELRAYGLASIDLALLVQSIVRKFDLDVPVSTFFGWPSVAACAAGLWASNEDHFRRYYERQREAQLTGRAIVEPASAPAGRAPIGSYAAVPAKTVRHEPQEVSRNGQAGAQDSEALDPRLRGDDSQQRFPRAPAAVIRARAQSRDRAMPDGAPVAIVGIAGKMPQSSSIEQFWEHLMAGRELITEIPKERWDWHQHYGDPHGAGNRTRVKWGSFLEGVDQFDNLFFGISPREAQSMDPRQRLLLETVWSAIENAGYSPAELAGTNTGLYVGVGNNDYSQMLRGAGVELTAHASTGLMVNSILASRISHLLDLRGPSEILDTACSSSTVALHRACRAIRTGECDAAIAGGVNVLLDPYGFVILDKAGVLSSDGKVRLFSEGATGYVRGEGVGAVVLKALHNAVADRDYVYAVIRGSALNHDGKSYSLTAPNPAAQAEVVLNAHREAGIDPATVSYIEAQGTGLPLADPVELEAFKTAFNTLYGEWGIAPDQPGCGIGYLKPSIGHLECASGIAALLKLLWALKTRQIPMVKNVDQAAAKRHLEDSPFYVVAANQPWVARTDRDGRPAPRRAGLHSFGFGGVNAHLVLEEYSGSG